MVIEKTVAPERPVLEQAWAWTLPRLSPDQTMTRAAFNPAELVRLIDHVSLIEGIFEQDLLVDFRIKVMSRVLAENIAELSGKTAGDAMPRDYFERWLHVGRFAAKHAKPFLTRSSVIKKDHRRSENLVVPIRVGGKVTQLLMFSDVWFPGVD